MCDMDNTDSATEAGYDYIDLEAEELDEGDDATPDDPGANAAMEDFIRDWEDSGEWDRP